jgi:hypothetical protein
MLVFVNFIFTLGSLNQIENLMKKNSILLLFVLATGIVANAQEFKKFKVGIGAGYAMASGEGASGGVLLTLEPAYRVMDQLSVGLRIESAIITRGLSEDPGNVSFDIAAIGSYTVNGQYYFNNNSFRPFVGAGLGLYSLAAVKIDGADGDAGEAESKFGFYPRVGFDFGHFTFAIDYNIIPSTKLVNSDAEFKNSYIGFRIGGFFGGGRK